MPATWVIYRKRLPGEAPIGDGLLAEPLVLEDEELEREKPHALVLHNDDFNSFGFVAKVLTLVLGIPFWKSVYLAIRVHFKGSDEIWSGARAAAEARAARIRSFGPDPQGRRDLPPVCLTVTVEAQ